jgi:hypothetical protein
VFLSVTAIAQDALSVPTWPPGIPEILTQGPGGRALAVGALRGHVRGLGVRTGVTHRQPE